VISQKTLCLQILVDKLKAHDEMENCDLKKVEKTPVL